MGVSGWNRLLAEKGWLPDTSHGKSCFCTTSLWMDLSVTVDQSNLRFSERIVAIPSGSELHIDGYCLCFHLYTVAYARNMDRVLYSKSNHQQRPCARYKNLQSLSQQQVRHLLPSFLPLKLLSDVTKEFIQMLLKHKMKIVVYWDGQKRYSFKPVAKSDKQAEDGDEQAELADKQAAEKQAEDDEKRDSFKQATDSKRQSSLDAEWSDFQQYCLYGRMPAVPTVCGWAKVLPKHRLFATQVLHALTVARVDMVFCDEEADHILAQAVRRKKHAYLVGFDSDFCFFPDVNYIPLSTLDASRNTVTACVIRRDTIAASLDLPDERAMIELAILMGNDYVNPTTAEFQNCSVAGNRNTNATLAFLREKGQGYRVTSSWVEVEETLQFVRTLYSLEDLVEFELQDDDNHLLAINSDPSATVRPHLPENSLDFQLAVIQPLIDRSVKEVVLRCLQAYVDRVPVDDHRAMLTQEHLTVFQQLVINERHSYKDVDKHITEKNWRPIWEDVMAVYMIEQIIRKSIWGAPKCSVVRLNPPYSFFDQYHYHALLRSVREKATLSALRTDTPLSPKTAVIAESEPVVENPSLPVDEFEDVILESVRKHRVTIIQGDTGCGKSSRIPIMLLRSPPPGGSPSEKSSLFISQPRRIAAKALVERLRAVDPDLRDQIALRMGHGVREYETKSTRAYFVTTGYLVRVLANNPKRFDNITYLIIDEIHERSVDTDIMCLLCRRLLKTNPRIRLVLMSATLAAALYQDYFDVSEPVIKVGARRFPVEEVYLNDLLKKVTLPGKVTNSLKELIKQCRDMKRLRPPSMSYMEKLYSLVAYLATVIGKPGSSVLVFVSGMNDIVAITELVEQLYVPGVTFTCFPIHSDLPFEDQMQVFVASKPDEVKIVIATNAAESSVTLPDVDNVICLGLCKQIVYNETSHRQMLLPTWISRASATQRAGRTGRLRPGTVYRMYERETYDIRMDAYEPGEMLRVPLDSVILTLKQIMPDEDITEVLLSCLEPPNISTIDRSFESLFCSHFITCPDDTGKVTTLGSFVSALGIDLALGSLIGLGIQFGVGAEAIQMAAILSFPKSAWIQSNPLIHEPADYNEKVARTFASKCHFDANLFSEPLAAMNLLWEYGRLNVGEKQRWSKFYGIFLPRIKRLESTCLSLCRRVADFSGVSDDLLRVTIPPSQLPHAMVTVLRIIQVWVFHETVIQFDPATVHIGRFKDGLTLDLLKKSDRIERSHLEQVLSTGRHPFTLKGHCEVRLKGTFSYKVGDVRNRSDVQFFDGFEERLISFSTEKGKSVAWVCFADYMAVYFREEVTKAPDFAEVSPMLFDCMDRSMLVARLSSGKAKRGRGERPCGLWTIHVSTINKPQGHEPDTPWLKFSFVKNKEVVKRLQKLEQELEYFVVASSLESVSFKFPWNAKSDNEKELLSFVLVVRGTNKSVTDVDLKDLLASPNVESSVKKSFDQQKVLFPCTPNSPLSFKSWGAPAATEQTTSWDRPLVKCIPEAARILSILASGRRREHVVRLPSMENTADDNYEEVVLRDLHLNPKQTNITHRWKRFDTSHSVYVETNSVPASAVPMFESEIMYCCCANTIEVGGGGLKAEGLTLLPPGKLFLLLCRVAFGLFRQENVDNGSIIQKSIQWVDPKCQESSKEFLENRINKALKFHFSSLELGEKLECFPEKVEELIAVFNGVDGYESEVWNSLKFNPFIGDNLERNRKKHKRSKQNLSLHKLETESNVLCDTTSQTKVRGTSLSECRVASNQEAVHVVAASSHRDPSISDSNGLNRGHGDERAKIKKQIDLAQPNYIPLVQTRELGEELNGFTRYTAFTTADLNVSERLFTSTLPPGHELNENDLPSSNILAIVVLQVRTETGSAEVGDCMSIDGPDWEVYTITVEGRTWYYAKFLSKDVAFVTRTSKTLSAWLKRTESSRARPNTISAALTCVPPNFAGNVQHKVVVSTNGKQKTLVFECLEMAVRMEAAFWLERQFLSGKRHWYQHHDIGHMVSKLKSEYYLAEKKRNAEN